MTRRVRLDQANDDSRITTRDRTLQRFSRMGALIRTMR
jgi:hypothetical protein